MEHCVGRLAPLGALAARLVGLMQVGQRAWCGWVSGLGAGGSAGLVGVG